MIKFRQKEYTIPEGHYTGPKDMDKVPGAIEVIGKSALAGAGIGGITGGILEDSTVLSGALQGGKYGTIAGTILKFFLNYLHNPMTTIKYQEVDKLIRREFGIYRAAGITVGDSLDKRAKVEEKFSFNDRDVTKYKLNFSIQDNAITMYTFGMTTKELDKTSETLDYYCKKYTGMEYNSYVINSRTNSYSVSIVFTNYQVIANFIMELSNVLNTKINLLDNKALVDSRLKAAVSILGDEGEERTYSVKEFNRYDIMKILGKGGIFSISPHLGFKGIKETLSSSIMGIILQSLGKLSGDEILRENGTTKRDNFGNIYLEDRLKKLHYIENYDYTVGDLRVDVNISMFSGVFIVTVDKGSKKMEKIDSEFWKSLKGKVGRVDTGKVIVYNYTIKTKNEFDFILKKFMSLDVEPNIFEK